MFQRRSYLLKQYFSEILSAGAIRAIVCRNDWVPEEFISVGRKPNEMVLPIAESKLPLCAEMD